MSDIGIVKGKDNTFFIQGDMRKAYEYLKEIYSEESSNSAQ